MTVKKGSYSQGVRTSSNPLETFKESSSSGSQNALDSLVSLGGGVLDQLLGVQHGLEGEKNENASREQQENRTQKQVKKEANLFSYQNYHETVLVKQQIKELVDQIRKEVDYLKKADKSLLQDVKDIEKLAIDSIPENPGIYDVKFLEIVLRVLQSVRMKVGESRTWLSALVSKKKKRGSLFAARSKKQGTAYSLSQELSTARSVQ